jgi:hypothetical protein
LLAPEHALFGSGEIISIKSMRVEIARKVKIRTKKWAFFKVGQRAQVIQFISYLSFIQKIIHCQKIYEMGREQKSMVHPFAYSKNSIYFQYLLYAKVRN